MPPSDQPALPDRGAGYRIEYPDPETRYLIPPERPNRGASEGTSLAERFEASTDGVFIDGRRFPWHVHLVPLQVDEISPGWSVVYLPVLVNGDVVAGAGVREALLTELIDGTPPPSYDQPGPAAHGSS